MNNYRKSPCYVEITAKRANSWFSLLATSTFTLLVGPTFTWTTSDQSMAEAKNQWSSKTESPVSLTSFLVATLTVVLASCFRQCSLTKKPRLPRARRFGTLSMLPHGLVAVCTSTVTQTTTSG